MKKYFKYLFCVVISMMCFVFNVDAETTTTTSEDKTCNYASRAYLNKLAGSVKASYDFKYENDGSISFDISIYNITEELYLTVASSGKTSSVNESSFEILPSMVKDNKYTFNVKDSTNIIKYEFIIKTLKFGCTHDIKKITLVKPKKNKFYDMDICKHDEVEDYYYCQEWITTDFAISDYEIERKIKEKKESVKKTTTTKCLQCEIDVRNTARKEKYNYIKMYIIIGLSIGIIVDLVVIVILIRNIRRATI